MQKAGYKILAKNYQAAVIVNIDGKDHYGNLEADFLVQKEKEKYVVMICNGEGSFEANDPSFRRRLLEYDRVFAKDAILLLDLNREELQKITFRFPKERGLEAFFQFLTALFIIFTVIGIIWVLSMLKLI